MKFEGFLVFIGFLLLLKFSPLETNEEKENRPATVKKFGGGAAAEVPAVYLRSHDLYRKLCSSCDSSFSTSAVASPCGRFMN